VDSLLFVQNIEREGPGLFGKTARDFNIPHQCLQAWNTLPDPSIKQPGAVIILGGPASANDSSPHIENLLEFTRKCLELQIPVLGICLGLQVLVKASGGKVLKNSEPEIGFWDQFGHPHTVELTR
jgi:GMP synthase (glutamine-hydrolysing)